jgi:hypothetical protein
MRRHMFGHWRRSSVCPKTWGTILILNSILTASPPPFTTVQGHGQSMVFHARFPAAWVELRPFLIGQHKSCATVCRRRAWFAKEERADGTNIGREERMMDMPSRHVHAGSVNRFVVQKKSVLPNNRSEQATSAATAETTSHRRQYEPPRKRPGGAKQSVSTGRSKIPLMSAYTDAGQLMADMEPFLFPEQEAGESTITVQITAQDAATLMNRLKQLGAQKHGGEK